MAKDKNKKVETHENCIGCGVCVVVCPSNTKMSKSDDFDINTANLTIYVDNGRACINYDTCITCGMCVRNCPIDALEMISL